MKCARYVWTSSFTIGRSARRRVLFVAHAAREGRVRIISARRATRREQR
ncbi:MAG: hypothetical protein DME04_07735 [Candidatus Rokuibacteriota bacterium]|nr:MAG: hypothetical protein DME04_07735 [Candidatus Rokubacteria bacterium]